MRRHDHALVDQGTSRERGQIEHRVLLLQLLLRATARHKQFADERSLVDVLEAVHEHHLDTRERAHGLGATGIRVRRHHAPTGYLQAFADQLRIQHLAGTGGAVFKATEEHKASREALHQRDTGFRRDRAQEALGLLQQQAAAVTGLAVSGYCTTVLQTVQRGNGRLHDPMRGLVVEVGDETKTATVFLVRRVVQAGRVVATVDESIGMSRQRAGHGSIP